MPLVSVLHGKFRVYNDNISYLIRTTRKTGGLLTGYKPVVLGQRLKALAFDSSIPHKGIDTTLH